MALDLDFKPFSGVGIISMYPRNATTGLPSGGGYDLGESSKLDITNNSPKLELNTSRSADRGVAFTMAQSKAGQVAIELRTLNDFVLGLLTGGQWTEAAAGGAVSNWAAPAGLVVGQMIKLPHQNVSAVTVTDSAGSPATLDVGDDYDIDLVGGTIKLKNVTGFTQPFLVGYTPGAVKVLGGFKAPDEDWIVHFDGVNAYDNSRAIVEIYRYRFAAEGQFSLIQTEFGTYQLTGSMQKDETKSASSAGGQYYKLVKPGA